MLSIVGIIAIVVFAIQVYKTASGTERNAPLWTIVTVVIGLALQFVVPFSISLIFAIYYLASGTSPENLESDLFGFALVVSILGIVLSVIGMGYVMKIVSKVKDDVPAAPPPPPPPNFGRDQ